MISSRRGLVLVFSDQVLSAASEEIRHFIQPGLVGNKITEKEYHGPITTITSSCSSTTDKAVDGVERNIGLG